MIAIIPNELRDVINKKLDAAFLGCPEAGKDRDIFYHQLLDYFDEHGEVPDFKITPKPNAQVAEPGGRKEKDDGR